MVLAWMGTDLLEGHHRRFWPSAAGDPARSAHAEPQRGIAHGAARAIVRTSVGARPVGGGDRIIKPSTTPT